MSFDRHMGGRGATRADSRTPHHVCFLYIAQSHQVLHSLSAATELARSHSDICVEVVGTSPEVLHYARLVAELTDFAPIRYRLLGPAWLRAFRHFDGVPPKLPMLALNAATLSRYDAIVAPERTTAILRSLGVRSRLVYTQHGAGDRAGPFEPRLGRFDLVFAAGRKQRDRMVAEGLVPADRCAIVGYPKFDLVTRLRPQLPDLFPTRRPTVLYNPHFSAALGSWPLWGRAVLEAFANQDRYNLIFAPHLRLFRGRSAQDTPELRPYRDVPHIHMDLGDTSAAVDMTYTRAADVYMGDVSSQAYEFLKQPRPCIFLNPRRLSWRGDPSFAHWQLGEVLEGCADFVKATQRAGVSHSAYLQAQVEAFESTFDLTPRSSSQRAADAIASLVGLRNSNSEVHPGRGGQAEVRADAAVGLAIDR